MAEPAPSTASPRSRLRLRFAGAVTLGALGLAALWRTFGTAWVLAAAGPGAYLAAYAWTHLGANHRPGVDGPRPRLGPANAITLFRGWLAVVLGGAAVASPPDPRVPVVLFGGAVGLDAVDGAVARRTRETVLGARLDGATDALAVLVGAAVAVALGALPAWYLLAGGVWYAYAGSLWWRRRTGAPSSRARASSPSPPRPCLTMRFHGLHTGTAHPIGPRCTRHCAVFTEPRRERAGRSLDPWRRARRAVARRRAGATRLDGPGDYRRAS